jgi:hypothetical protein
VARSVRVGPLDAALYGDGGMSHEPTSLNARSFLDELRFSQPSVQRRKNP